MALDTLAAALIAVEDNPDLLRGEKGDKGDKGDTGLRGPQGVPGTDGSDGAAGKDGPSGLRGAAGTTGAKGEKGDKGDKGEKGDDGKDGKDAAIPILGARPGRGGGIAGITVKNAGTPVGQPNGITSINYTAGGATDAGHGQIDVSGGSGLPPGGTPGQVVTNTAPGVGDWEDAAGGFPNATGSGSPVGTIDPTSVAGGYSYIDTENGALYLVVVTGTGNIWGLIGGEIDSSGDYAEGVIIGSGVTIVGESRLHDQVGLTDIDALTPGGSANGVFWRGGGGGDGNQRFEVRVGSIGAQMSFQIDRDYSTSLPGDLYANDIYGNVIKAALSKLAFFGVTSVAQQTAASLSDLWTALVAYGLLDTGSVAPSPAADPGDIADTTIATAETVGDKLNALMGAMRTAGLLA